MGVVEPQREIMRKICPQFREMEPHGVDNYCCGGGSGFAIMSGNNFPGLALPRVRAQEAGAGPQRLRRLPGPGDPQVSLRSVQQLQGPVPRHAGLLRPVGEERILYGGLVELIVNAMTDVKPGFIEWEWH